MEKDISNTTQELKNLNDELKEAQENVGKLNNKPVEVKVKGEEKVSELREQFQNLAENSADAVEAFANFAGIEIEDDKMQAVRDLGGAVAGMLDPAKWSSPMEMLKEGFTALTSLSKLFGDETAEKMQEIRQEMKETAEAFEEAKEKLGEELFADTSRLGSARKLVEDIVTRLGAGETGDGIDGMVGHLLEIVPEAEDGVRKIGDAWQVNVDVLDDVLDKLERQAEMSYYAGQVDEAYAAKRKQDKALEEQLELVEPGEVELLTPEQVEQKIMEVRDSKELSDTEKGYQIDLLDDIKETGGYYGNYADVVGYFEDLNGAYQETQKADAAYKEARQEMSNYVDGENERSANEYKTPEWVDDLNDALRPFENKMKELKGAERHLQEGRYDLAANKLGVEFDEKDDDVAKAEKLREEINEQKEEAGKEITMAQIDAIEGIKMTEELTAAERVELERYSEKVENALEDFPGAFDKAMGWMKNGVPVNIMVNGKKQSIITTDETQQNAQGTNWFPGGMTVINERGDELIELPTGSRIYPAQESGRQMQEVRSVNPHIEIYINSMIVREEADIDNIARQLYDKLLFYQKIMP